MEITHKSSPRLGEKYTKIIFDSGLTAFIIHKNHISSYAIFGVNFGSADCKFLSPEGKVKTFPAGIAHFLEHKMYETKDGDAMIQYALYGGDANAYTAGDRTMFYFLSSESFYENLEVLINHVTHPHITKKSVEKEKAIIIQEINMYNDNPSWRVRNNMMKCLYGNSSISRDPAGSSESIMAISKKTLDDCYKTVYNLSNMVLCVCGNIDEIEFVRKVENLTEKSQSTVFTRVDETPENKVLSECIDYMDISLPVFSVGVRFPSPRTKEGVREFAAVEIIMSLLFDKTTAFYYNNYHSGEFERLSFSYQTMRKAFFGEISGLSKNPRGLFEKIKEHITAVKETGFSDTDFQRAKKALYADTICDYDSVENIADTFVSFYFEGDDMLDYPDIVANLTKDYAEECLRRLFDINNMCLSVIFPKKEVNS